MREGVKRMRDFMDSPGMQGPAERMREQRRRDEYMKNAKKKMKILAF